MRRSAGDPCCSWLDDGVSPCSSKRTRRCSHPARPWGCCSTPRPAPRVPPSSLGAGALHGPRLRGVHPGLARHRFAVHELHPVQRTNRTAAGALRPSADLRAVPPRPGEAILRLAMLSSVGLVFLRAPSVAAISTLALLETVRPAACRICRRSTTTTRWRSCPILVLGTVTALVAVAPRRSPASAAAGVVLGAALTAA